MRILALLEREELAVQELMDVLGMAQSRVSRHLAILREAGLLRDRRDGTYVFYRFALPRERRLARRLGARARRNLRDDPTAERDAAALGRVMEARAARIRSFFDAVGPEWDALRKVFNDDALRARAIARLRRPEPRRSPTSAPGTGILASELARLGLRVIAVDHSSRMLEAARAKLEQEGLAGVELRQGEASALPLADAEVDAALAHMVLHYLPSPAEAIREMARVVKPGGVVVVVDFVCPRARVDAPGARRRLARLLPGGDRGLVRRGGPRGLPPREPRGPVGRARPAGHLHRLRKTPALIRAVLFDAAGTLIAPREPVGESYARLARDYGVALSAWRLDDAFRRIFAQAEPMVFPEAAPEEIPALERDWWRRVVRATFLAADSTDASPTSTPSSSGSGRASPPPTAGCSGRAAASCSRGCARAACAPAWSRTSTGACRRSSRASASRRSSTRSCCPRTPARPSPTDASSRWPSSASVSRPRGALRRRRRAARSRGSPRRGPARGGRDRPCYPQRPPHPGRRRAVSDAALGFLHDRFGLDDRSLVTALDTALEREVDYADLFFEYTARRTRCCSRRAS